MTGQSLPWDRTAPTKREVGDRDIDRRSFCTHGEGRQLPVLMCPDHREILCLNDELQGHGLVLEQLDQLLLVRGHGPLEDLEVWGRTSVQKQVMGARLRTW